ncbi:MAG: IS1634 family transposase, partial [Nitrososphaera sp.]
MFIREIKSKNKTYLHIIESFREDGKIKHRSIAALGCLDDLRNTDQLQRIARALLKYSQHNPNLLDISTVEEKSRKRWGAVAVAAKLWKSFGLGELFASLIEKRKIQFEFFSAVFLMLLDRFREPKSKLKSYQQQDCYHGIIDVDLHNLYRALDLLAESKQSIEEYLFEKNASLWNMKVDLVLYDVTTFYFESVRADGMREFGYGKDGNVNEVQVMLGLLTDMEGRPIGFDLFPGNICEGKTLEQALNKLSKRFKLGRLILIADQAMFSQANIQMIRDAGYEYIIGGRIKSRGQKIKDEILDPAGYLQMSSKESEELFKVKTIKVGDDDLICSWSKKRAEKDKRDRERLIDKAKKIIEQKKGSIVSKRGALKYIEINDKITGKISEPKIANDEQWDGYYGIQTNAKQITPENLLGYYHNLWRIEESFRIFKSHLDARPVFHWTEKRINGHFVLCFIAFLLERTLELELKRQKIEYSPARIRKALDDLQYSEIVIEGKEFWVTSPVTGLA